MSKATQEHQSAHEGHSDRSDLCSICHMPLEKVCRLCYDDHKSNCPTITGVCNHCYHYHCLCSFWDDLNSPSKFEPDNSTKRYVCPDCFSIDDHQKEFQGKELTDKELLEQKKKEDL